MGQLGDLSPEGSIAVRLIPNDRPNSIWKMSAESGVLGRSDCRVDLDQSTGDRAHSATEVASPRGREGPL